MLLNNKLLRDESMKTVKIKVVAALIILGLFLLISEGIAKTITEYFIIGLSMGWIVGFTNRSRYLN